MRRKRIVILLAASICAVAIGLFGPIASTLSTVLPQGPTGVFAIRNARIITVTGPVIENGTVVITNGKIAAVGANVSIPSGAKVIEARGLSVYPGMIDADTEIGLTEIGSVAGSVD